MADDPSVVWTALAPLLAGQPRVRLSRDGGKTYPQKFERDLTAGLPSVPAAVRIFGKDGTCRALFFDFDVSKGGLGQVSSDVAALQGWLSRHRVRWIEDHSPSGGRHVYVPLERPVPFSDARELVEALGNRLPSLDKTPHQNLLHGCMRVPGSRHKTGGHQQLAMSLSMAFDVLKRPNGPAAWDAMRTDLSAEINAARSLRLELDQVQATTPIRELTADSKMSVALQNVARTGLYDASRYSTNSEARQGVIAAAVAAGMDVTEIYRRMAQGTWPGLASFYARYSSTTRMDALRRDWDKARTYLSKQLSERGKSNDHKNPTSQPNTQPLALHGRNSTGTDSLHRFIRTWRNAVTLTEHKMDGSRSGLARRMVLRAIGEAAHKTGNSVIEFGTRSIAVATGLDHTTVAGHLRALRSSPDPLIALLQEAHGIRGDQYELVIPQTLAESAAALSWKGRAHALRPVFRVLGFPAAFVYEAVEQSTTPLPTAELVRITKLSRTAVSEALEILAAWSLVERGGSGWVKVPGTSLSQLAEYFGVLDEVAEQVKKYRQQRAEWREWLATRTAIQALPSPDEDYPWEIYEGPPDDMTLADLAFREAG